MKPPTAKEFTDSVCDRIKETLYVEPNDLFRVECEAMGRLVAKSQVDSRQAAEAMMQRFVFSQEAHFHLVGTVGAQSVKPTKAQFARALVEAIEAFIDAKIGGRNVDPHIARVELTDKFVELLK